MDRLLYLYKKTQGGHEMLPETEFQEYAVLRKAEYLGRKTELLAGGAVAVQVVKDDAGDIVGWTYQSKPLPAPVQIEEKK